MAVRVAPSGGRHPAPRRQQVVSQKPVTPSTGPKRTVAGTAAVSAAVKTGAKAQAGGSSRVGCGGKTGAVAAAKGKGVGGTGGVSIDSSKSTRGKTGGSAAAAGGAGGAGEGVTVTRKRVRVPVIDKELGEIVVLLQPYQGDHNDICEKCNLGGELLCCDFCNIVYHLQCVTPKLTKAPEERLWICPDCTKEVVAKRASKRRRPLRNGSVISNPNANGVVNEGAGDANRQNKQMGGGTAAAGSSN
ncbi:unnamed protein product, partial [Discosporangium mesarthrocarpum]